MKCGSSLVWTFHMKKKQQQQQQVKAPNWKITVTLLGLVTLSFPTKEMRKEPRDTPILKDRGSSENLN